MNEIHVRRITKPYSGTPRASKPKGNGWFQYQGPRLTTYPEVLEQRTWDRKEIRVLFNIRDFELRLVSPHGQVLARVGPDAWDLG